MDSSYLKDVVGAALSEGLAECAIKQPLDPVEFLGNFLLSFEEKSNKSQQVRLFPLFSSSYLHTMLPLFY